MVTPSDEDLGIDDYRKFTLSSAGSWNDVEKIGELASDLGVAENYTGSIPFFFPVPYEVIDPKTLPRRQRFRMWRREWAWRFKHAWSALKGKDCCEDCY